MEHLLAGVGLGGILSTLAGAKEVLPCSDSDSAQAPTDNPLGCHHRLPCRSYPRYSQNERREERPRASQAQRDRRRSSMGLHKHTLRDLARESLHAHSRCRLSLDAVGAREPGQVHAALPIRRPIRTYILYRRLPHGTRQSRTLFRRGDTGAKARDRGDIRDGRQRAAAVMGKRARRRYGEYGRAEEVACCRADTAGCSAVIMAVILLLSRRSAESHPLEAQRNNTAARLASKREAGILDFALKL